MDNNVAAEAWRTLAEINANLQRWGDAREDIENALRHQPFSRPLRLSRALESGGRRLTAAFDVAPG